MSDAWDSAARRIIAKREQDEREAAEETARARSEAAAEKEAREQAYRYMEAVIDEVAPQLEALLHERGEAAMRLLAARGNNSFIYFGGEQEGGSFVSYCFTSQGLQVVHGRTMGYESVNNGARPASAREVVTAFAYQGAGYRQPDAVRDVVNWFVRQIEQYAT